MRKSSLLALRCVDRVLELETEKLTLPELMRLYRIEVLVLAKGQDELAARIVRTAEEHKVAVVENVPLARALYASTDLNQVIPPELYNAVAEVLVYLYRMDQKIP